MPFTVRRSTPVDSESAARICFAGADARKTIEPAEFAALRPALDDCARRFFRVAAGGEPLDVLDAQLAVTVEDDLDAKLSYRRPARSPLVFDAVTLGRLASRATAGVVPCVMTSGSYTCT